MANGKNATGYLLYNCLLSAATGLTNTILPIYAKELGGDIAAIGSILTFSYFSGFAVAFIWSSISDRTGKRAPYIFIGTAALLIAAILQTFAQNVYYLLMIVVLGNLFGSGVYPIFMTLVGETTEQGKRGRSMGIFFIGSSAGFAFSISLVGFISERYGTKTVFYVSAVLLFFALIMLRKFLWKPSIQDYPKKSQISFLKTIKDTVLLGGFMIFWVAALCLYISDQVKMNYLLLFFEQELSIKRSLGSLILSIGTWTEIPSHLFFGSLSDKIGRKPLILLGLFTVFISNILISLSQNYLHVGMTMILYGMAWGSFASASSAYVTELVDEERRAKAMTLYNSTFAIGGIIAPAVMSFAVLETSFRTAFIIISMISITGFFLVAFGIREFRSKTDRNIRP